MPTTGPSLIAVRTHIGFGSPNKHDSQKAHGSPLGPDEVRLTKEAYGWDPDQSFYVPDEAREHFRAAIPAGEDLVAEWEARFDAVRRRRTRPRRPSFRRRIDRAPARRLGRGPHDVRDRHRGRDPEREPGRDPGARRRRCPSCSAAPPTCPSPTSPTSRASPNFSADEAGRNLRFGVREHGMGGDRQRHRLSRRVHPLLRDVPDVQRLHARRRSGWRRCPGSTSIYVWTHDSVGLGEDGPTHQPVEHYAALRAIPNLWFVRPGDANETAAAWALAVERDRDGPGRAGPHPPEAADAAGHGRAARARASRRGGYVLREARGGDAAADPHRHRVGAPARVRGRRGARGRRHPDAGRVAPLLGALRGPGPGLSRRGPAAGRPEARVSVEVGVSLGWERWVGDEGAIIGLDHFGASAPGRHDLRAVRVHGGSRRRRRPAGRPRRPARPDPDPRRRPLRRPSDARARRLRASAGPALPIRATPDPIGVATAHDTPAAADDGSGATRLAAHCSDGDRTPVTPGTPSATPSRTAIASDVVDGPDRRRPPRRPDATPRPLSADLEALPAIDDTEPARRR